eukprot:TRINITY_DN108795_c0_g1_i1.p1 TRINITY_DN108795_c0_g1~~TRINITY_DN108795_c0_g1_i1.p1  ORF type:complete len:384 (+),score=60.88 TRINITY_DN108795_c0_g1_i1:74-1153(+)
MAPVKPGAVVAVTGAAGFIGSHVCDAALAAGYHVRAVVRNPGDQEKVQHLLALNGAKERLSLHKGLLDVPGSYDEAFAGAEAVIHTAAVVEIMDVSDPEDQIVRPSVEGVKNVLASADKTTSVRRFIHTSSEIAVLDWQRPPETTFSEVDWNSSSTMASGDYYGYAKATAERIVLDHKSQCFDTLAILPGVNLGPCMTKSHTKSSAVIVRQLLFGNTQPEYHAHFVDVRDTAAAHVCALGWTPAEAGDCRRFICCSDNAMKVSELEAQLKRLFPEYKINAAPHPGPILQGVLELPLFWRVFLSEFRRAMALQQFKLDNSRVKSLLANSFRPLDDTLRDTVKSMVDTGFVKARTSGQSPV